MSMDGAFGWGDFLGLCAIATCIYAAVRPEIISQKPFKFRLILEPLFGRNQLLGAEIMVAQWMVMESCRRMTGDLSPVEINAVVDGVTSALFLLIALRKRAAWAAVCFLIHVSMLVLHLAYFSNGETSEIGYISILNVLFGASLVTIITAIWTGRHEVGSRVDDFFASLWTRWSWSGVRSSRIARYNE